jgi:hypothetical protein
MLGAAGWHSSHERRATESDRTMSSESDEGNSEGDAGERVVGVYCYLVG